MTEAITLPSPSAAPANVAPAALRRGGLLDITLVAIVPIFAFLAASFPARNADLWQHLAIGQSLLRESPAFGVDPFAYTTEGAYWTNHSWLFDALAYALYQSFGGAGLVVVKALLVTALAGLMLSVRRRESGWVVPAACVLVALVALSPRLLLQPACVSFFLLAVCLRRLWRMETSPIQPSRREQVRRAVPLLILFVWWVNLDTWFFLGPVLVALFWVGDRLGGRSRVPWWLALLGLAVCVLSPHHVHAFALPAELSPSLWRGLASGPRFARHFASPWQLGVQLDPTAMNFAELAYFLLVAAGIVSFALERSAWRDWRLPVWLVFALLGAWRVRTVPFFAVVAGPVMALNFQDLLRRRRGSQTMRGVAGIGVLAAGVALLGLVLGGGLFGAGGEGRRVGWSVQVDPSLERVAGTLAAWRQQGHLGASEHVFNLHPDLASTWAWFCPQEKGFIDSRLPLFRESVSGYEAVCSAILPGPQSAQGMDDRLQSVFRRYRITHLVVYDPNPAVVTQVMARLDGSGAWALERIDGKAVLYAWRPSGWPFTDFDAHARRIALAPHEQNAEAEVPAPPAQGPGRGPRQSAFLDRLLNPFAAGPAATWEGPAASAYLRAYDDSALADQARSRQRARAAFAVAMTGQSALPAGPATATALAFRGRFSSLFLASADERSPALPLLAVRLARRALAANPDDAMAWLRLGQAYFELSRVTAGPDRETVVAPLAMLRHIQIATALENAVALAPDLGPAHETLAVLYTERRYLDVGLDHARLALDLGRRSGPVPGESQEMFTRRLESTGKQVTDLERLVQDLQNRFAVRSREAGDNAVARARMARDMGLPRLALDDVLAQAQGLLFGAEAVGLQVELQLMLGRAAAARVVLADEDLKASRTRLGHLTIPGPPPLNAYRLPAYDWLCACRAAAEGDYDEAQAQVEDVREHLASESGKNLHRLRTALPRALVWDLGTHAQPRRLFLQDLARQEREGLSAMLAGTQLVRLEHVDLGAVAGLLALERGQPARAEELLRAADAEARELAGTAGLHAPGRAVVLAYLRRIEAARRDERERR